MQNHQVPVATPNIGDTYRLSKHLATPPLATTATPMRHQNSKLPGYPERRK